MRSRLTRRVRVVDAMFTKSVKNCPLSTPVGFPTYSVDNGEMPDPAPLSVLDLSPVASGSTAAEALHRTLDLARRCEAAGYRRYWLAEHHFAPGVASAAPAVLIGAVAGATSTIRVGSAAVLLGHRTALSVAEEFGTLAALHGDRIDLGLGKSGHRPGPAPDPERGDRVVDGLLVPAPFGGGGVLASPAFRAMAALLKQPGAEPEPFTEQLTAILDLVAGRHRTADGVPVVAVAASAGRPQVWVLGSSAGESAQAAGALGLPFATNYHVSPAGVLEAAQAYRESFRPSPALDRPHLAVSADVTVAETDERAAELAAGYPLWVLSIRNGSGARPFPSPAEVAAHVWTDEERALVDDRVRTQFVGSPATVAERLATLQRVTGADELVVTTITHDHEARARSFELLAQEWLSRPAGGARPATGSPARRSSIGAA